MLKSPQLRKVRRKGTPCKAPSSSRPKPSPSHLPPSGTLLLLAFLREGKKPTTTIDNTRHKAPISPSSAAAARLKAEQQALVIAANKRKRERDLLPPALVGYGRGKRSVSASVSNAGDLNTERGMSPDLGIPPPPPATTAQQRGRATAAAGPALKGLTIATTTTAINSKKRRADSMEPLSPSSSDVPVGVYSHLSHNTVGTNNNAPFASGGGRTMTRASSAGPHHHHHHHHYHQDHESLHVPSPLARSFSLAGGGGGGGETNLHKRAVSAGHNSGGAASGSSLRERESRRLDAPHHLQGYELGGAYVS
ncbi:hypothetical protein T439DRAFT_378309 [Meredithblackwellia eburnea MCA 4105]